VDEAVWEWARTASGANYFLPGSALPWRAEPAYRTQVVVPLQPDPEAAPIGAVYLALPPQGIGPVINLLPAVSALAAQICTTLSRAASHTQELAHQRVMQELSLAGTIQASFLPVDLPAIEGWELGVTLAPALQTTGDFFDWITLPDGRLGIVIADVVDKGLGAALFMALSRTLIRTYAIEHPDRPDLALAATNRRILQDTHRPMFVTVFYGILDARNGTLTYCNAGHNAPYFIHAGGDATIQPLPTTGMPLGILEELTWGHAAIRFEPGDLLLLYTDGLTDAQNDEADFFGSERLLAIAEAHRGRTASDLQQALLGAVYGWMGDAPQFDDLTLLILGRNQ
ncbi:MAG TPA: PP2C family protein-serine/threonine phosphatase, partial [Ardenticatenaceae bacterium]